jgi:nicotinate-nucleotide pyrophosphorylase
VERRPLGAGGPEVSVVGMGTWRTLDVRGPEEASRRAIVAEALDAGAKMVLLDNMDLATLREAVRINAGRAILEISGGVTLETLRALAATGVDRISIGTLTKDVKATDFSMRLKDLE